MFPSLYHRWKRHRGICLIVALLMIRGPCPAAELPGAVSLLFEDLCLDCHDSRKQEGGLDLSALELEPADEENFAQ